MKPIEGLNPASPDARMNWPIKGLQDRIADLNPYVGMSLEQAKEMLAILDGAPCARRPHPSALPRHYAMLNAHIADLIRRA